uniref:Uncharacterized protein n=1 Tax=Fagus sylvatica TaxID=28930 RepID=A0A2N9FXF0_FAGSY
MGHAAYRRKALDVLFPTIPVKRGMLSAKPRVPRRSWSRYLSNAPGLAGSTCCEQERLCARRRLSGRKNAFSSQRVFLQILSQFARIFDLAPDVGFRRSWYRRKACAAYFCKVPDSRKSELGLVRYGSREQRPPEVFLVRLRAVFRSGIPARPDKFLAIREFHVVHECVFFPTCPGLADQLVASQEDSARKRGNVGGKIPEFSAQPYFVGLFSRAWPCTEASLGSQDMILANGGRWNVPYAKGFDHNSLVSRPFLARKVSNRSSSSRSSEWSREWSVRFSFSVWSTVRSNLGQTWSTLVKLGRIWSKLSKLWEMYPGPHFEGFWAWWTLVGLGNGSVKPRSNFGQPWSNLVNLGQTLGNVSRTFFLGVFDAARPSPVCSKLVSLYRELEEAHVIIKSAARVESLRSTLHHNSVAVANLRRDLVAQRGNVSTLRTMNEFIREQLEISEDAKEQLEETLAEAREQLETEQAERTRVQDELDSLRSYTQALVDPATGRPQDIVGPPTGARCELSWTWCMMLLSPMLLGSIRRAFPVVTALHQINQVMDSLGTRARAVWEEHDEGDPALSTALGRFCRETCIRLGH